MQVLEVEEDMRGSETRLIDEGRLERILETLFKKKLLKVSARDEGLSCEGRESLFLL